MGGRDKLQRVFERFEKALGKYLQVVNQQNLFANLEKEILIEVVTKRFEYTFESMWKSLMEFFRTEGIICTTPMQCFREALKAGIISEEYEEIFPAIVEKRNRIVHIYDFEQAAVIYDFIKSKDVVCAISHVYENLKRHIYSHE